MAAEGIDSRDVTLRDYIRVVWRRKWVVIGMTALFLALALGYSFTRTPMYEASATLIYETQLNVADPLSSGQFADATLRQTELSSVASVIASPDIIASARQAMGQRDIAAGYSVSAAVQTTTGQSDASTVLVTAASPSARTAAAAASAFATAFTAFRKTQVQAQVRQAEQVVQSKLDSFKSPVSRQSADYVTLLQRLQDLQILEATVTGNFRVLVPATPPGQPFSPKPRRNGEMGLAAGLVLGIGLILLLEQFDTRVRTADEAAAIFGMPVVGNMPKLSSKALASHPMVVLGDSRGRAAEAIRKLRGNLEFANVDGDLKSLFITSSLQHEGKSLVVCNLAVSLAATGANVVLVDGDMRRPQVHAYLELPNGTGLSTVLTGRSELHQTLRSRTVGLRLTEIGKSGELDAVSQGGERLHVLTSGPLPPNPAEILASRSFSSLMAQLRTDFDMVIVDAPSVLAVGDSAAIARSVDGIVFLMDLTRAKRPLLEEAAAQIMQMPCRKLGLVLVGPASRRHYSYDHYSDYAHGESPVDASAGKSARRESARV